MKTVMSVFAWLILPVGICLAQEKQESFPYGINYPDNCEGSMARLDSIRSEALNSASKETIVIVVARLGKGEVSRVHNRSRLSAAKQYLSQFGVPIQRIVLAEGESAKGLGRVEFYVTGKLQDVLLINRNKGLCIECCNPRPEDFISYRRKKKKRK